MPPAPSDPWVPRKLRGPFPELTAYCATVNDLCLLTIDELQRFGEPMNLALPPRGAFLAVQFVGQASGPFAQYDLAVRTAAGWFVHDLGVMTNEAVSGAWTGSATPESLRYENVDASGTPAVVAVIRSYGSAGGSWPPEEYYESSGASLLLCGIGSSHVPACSKLLELTNSTTDATGNTTGFELAHDFPGSGILRLQLRSGEPDETVRRLIGTHAIAFP